MTNISETDKRLDNILEIEGELVDETEEEENHQELVPVEEFPVPALPQEEATPDRDVEFDYELSRNTHRDLIDMGTEAVEGALKVAKESQNPRAYEVAGNMLKNISDITDKLMNLHEKRKSMKKNNGQNEMPSINVEKGVFVGSTADLLKQIRKDK